MATLKAVIKKCNKRLDGSWNVVIRFTHNGKVIFLHTTTFVSKKDIKASFIIKDASILERGNGLIENYRKRASELNLEFNDIDIDMGTNANCIERKQESRGISFSGFADKCRKHNSKKKGMSNCETAIMALVVFYGRKDILCQDNRT